MGRLAVVLFNLGGPDSPEAVKPYLRNLFEDPAIIRLPWPLRQLVARVIADRRAPYAREEIFARIGGASPILPNTQAQADALATSTGVRVFIAMRYWHPRAVDTARNVAAYAPDKVLLLPLYPQFSTTTTASSMKEFEAELSAAGYRGAVERICCYPTAEGWIAALVNTIKPALERAGIAPLLLFSAHGLPQSVVRDGDPYVWQVEQTAKAVVARLGDPQLDWSICYQSRVGPMKWTGPSIDEEVRRAAEDKQAIVIAPIAFVSEHSETLVELDIKYREMAQKLGAPAYVRVPAVGIEPNFIQALGSLVRAAANAGEARLYCNPRICPKSFGGCPNYA